MLKTLKLNSAGPREIQIGLNVGIPREFDFY